MTIRFSLGLAAAALMLTGPALAQDAPNYPAGPVKIIVPYNPGGSTDAGGRLIAQSLTEQLGQPFVVENKPGASGVIGTEFVTNAEPDGQTVLVHTAVIGIHPAFKADLPYDTTGDLRAVSIIGSGPFVLVVNPLLPVETVQELVDYINARPDEFNFGSAGVGSTGHLIAERFNAATGLDMVHVPYAGGGPSEVGLMSNEVQVMFNGMTGLSLIKEGKMKALAVTSDERWPGLPEVPTMAEAGFPESTLSTWIGAFVPKATPDDIVNDLSDAIATAVADSATADRFYAVGLRPVGSTAVEAEATLASDIAGWTALAATGLKVN